MTTAAATYALPYEHTANSQTLQILGTTGAVGDYLHRMVVTVNTAATSTVVLTDFCSHYSQGKHPYRCLFP